MNILVHLKGGATGLEPASVPMTNDFPVDFGVVGTNLNLTDRVVVLPGTLVACSVSVFYLLCC